MSKTKRPKLKQLMGALRIIRIIIEGKTPVDECCEIK